MALCYTDSAAMTRVPVSDDSRERHLATNDFDCFA